MKPEAGSEGTFKQCNGQWVPCNESCSTYIEWSETIWLEYWKTLDLEDCDVFIRAVNTVPLLCQHFWQKPVRCTDEMMRPLFIQAFVYMCQKRRGTRVPDTFMKANFLWNLFKSFDVKKWIFLAMQVN